MDNRLVTDSTKFTLWQQQKRILAEEAWNHALPVHLPTWKGIPIVINKGARWEEEVPGSVATGKWMETRYAPGPPEWDGKPHTELEFRDYYKNLQRN